MKIVETRLLRGPNIHSPRPVLMAVLDLEALADLSSAQLPGFVDRLLALMPTLVEHRCSLRRRGGFVERLREGTYLAHVTEHVLIELQCLSGPTVGFGKARAVRGVPGRYRIVCSYAAEPLRALARQETLGPSTRAIVEAARARRVPVTRLSTEASLFQLGWGASAQRVRATITGRTSLAAVQIASDKHLTKRLLADAGIPVPRGEIVRLPDEAVAVWSRLRGPAAVKPLDGNQGKGVTVDVRDEAALRAAFERAAAFGRRVIVEAHVAGEDHRVLVVGGKAVAAAKRRPPMVTGDGVRSVRALIDAENRGNPLRGEGHGSALTRIPVDAGAVEALAKQGLDLDTVPAAGLALTLRSNANLSTGGTAEDVTDAMHPDVARACVRAAGAVGLDVAGIDLVCADIGRPLDTQGGAIIEVNAAPGIRMHEQPSAGRRRRAGAAIVESLFPKGCDGRIPLIAVTGTNGKTTTTLAIAGIVRAAGLVVGAATTEGVSIGGRAIARGDRTGYWSSRMVLGSPEVQAAVLETARGGMLKRGLGFDRCDVGVVLNVQGDHLGLDGIDTMRQLAHLKGLVARTARRAAVLNADDRHCMAMVDTLAPGCRPVLFSMRQGLRAMARTTESPDASRGAGLAAHVAADGHAVLLDGTVITLVEGGEKRTPVVDVRELPFTLAGMARHNVANALAAAAAAWAAGFDADTIRAGLVAFRSDNALNPMRMNLFRVAGTTVVVDYAHNAAAYHAVADTGRRLGAKRLVGVVTVPGDRPDLALEQVGATCARAFDELVLYEMDDRRGRAHGEIVEHIGRAAIGAGFAPALLHRVPDLRDAIRAGLARCGPQDVLIYGCATTLDDLRHASPGPIEELEPPRSVATGHSDPAGQAAHAA